MENMNCYTMESIKEGIVEGFNVTITEEMLDSFLKITGDINPMHNDDEFARSRGYDKKIVYGMLTASFISTLAGVYLPGKNCIIHSVETNFVKPVFVGDTLLVQGTVRKADPRFGQVEIKVDITNQNGKKVVRGLLKVGVTNEQ